MRIPEKVADAYRPEIGEELPGEAREPRFRRTDCDAAGSGGGIFY